MANYKPEELDRLVDLALAAPRLERAALLDRECAGDTELRDRVEAMVIAAEDHRFLAAATGDMLSSSAGIEILGDAPPSHSPGTRIGPYKLLQLIGEGGFGSVFMAEQEKPVQRRVALKIIKLGMDTRQVIARFESERQALAMMDHPGIARVFDAGATDVGRPYFVMELVKGEPITEYCDKNKLSIDHRLELFAQVCAAVQHAHTKGIIHRDLKPGNILVSTHDGRPVAKVIDFGIAKATSGKLSEKTLFTEHRQLIGTPEYMSPEQAEGSLDIDTRTDVYALGVVLYELLTGTTPFDSRSLRSAAYAEIQRIIREVEPPNPSTRLGQSAESLPSVAARRHTEPRRLGAIVRGELDWMVMKALDKDRRRRYETAGSFALDVQNYLADEPVLAGPPSRVYRVRELVRRNRAAFAGAGAIGCALVVGLGVATYGFVMASRARASESGARVVAENRRLEAETAWASEKTQRAAAEANEKRARTEGDRARVSNDFLVRTLLARANPEYSSGKDLTVLQVVDGAAADIDAGSLASQPSLEAQSRAMLGKVYRSLSHPDKGVAQLEAALPLIRQVWGEPSTEFAAGLGMLGDAQLEAGLYAEAATNLNAALVMQSRFRDAGDPEVFWIRYNLATLMVKQGNDTEAEAMFRDLLAQVRASGRAGSRDEADVLVNLSAMLESRPDGLKESLLLGRRAVELLTQWTGAESVAVCEARHNLARTLRTAGDLTGAEAMFREALAVAERRLPAQHDTLASIRDNLAALLRDLGRLDEAEPLARRALEARRATLGDAHAETAYSLGTLAGILLDKHDFKAAESMFHEELASWSAQQGVTELDSTGAMTGLAQALIGQGRFAEAEPIAADALQARRAVLPPGDWMIASAAATRGKALAGMGQAPQAEPLLLEAAESMRDAKKIGPRGRVFAIAALVEFYLGAGRTQEAATWKAVLDGLKPP